MGANTNFIVMDQSTAAASPRKKRKTLSNGENGSESLNVAFQGQLMSYTYLAAEKFFQSSSKVQLVSKNSVQDIFEVVIKGECTYGVIPLESSSFGTIHAVYDRLLANNGNLQIVGELGQIEQHCLCIKANDQDKNELDIGRVISHPHILDCCSDYLKSLDSRRQSLHREHIERLAAWDTAAGCAMVANETLSTSTLTSNAAAVHTENKQQPQLVSAAICSKEAAQLHGMKIVVEAIGNDKNAETRYIVIAKAITSTPPPSNATTATTTVTTSTRTSIYPLAGSGIFLEEIIDPLDLSRQGINHNKATSSISSTTSTRTGNGMKRSIAMALRNIPGAIFKMSSCFAFRNIDIIKIESRPSTAIAASFQQQFLQHIPLQDRPFSQRHWDLIFYIDYEPSDHEEVNQALMKNLEEYCLWYRVLGSFRSGLHQVHVQPSEWSQMVDIMHC